MDVQNTGWPPTPLRPITSHFCLNRLLFPRTPPWKWTSYVYHPSSLTHFLPRSTIFSKGELFIFGIILLRIVSHRHLTSFQPVKHQWSSFLWKQWTASKDAPTLPFDRAQNTPLNLKNTIACRTDRFEYYYWNIFTINSFFIFSLLLLFWLRSYLNSFKFLEVDNMTTYSVVQCLFEVINKSTKFVS